MRTFLFFVVLLILITSTPALAHTTGASWVATSSPYIIDVGYDPMTSTAGNYTRFDFILWKDTLNTGEQVDYGHVWVRILKDDKTLLATGIYRQPLGPTTLLYRFQEPGSYILEASFRAGDGSDLAVAKFPITVASAGVSGAPFIAALSGVSGFILGVLALMALRRFTRA